MEDAVAHVSGNGRMVYGARRLFYRVRDLIQAIMSKRFHPEKGYKHFKDLLVEYQEIRGPLEALYYDPRGRLHEPHSGKTVDLGNLEVAAYEFPPWVYDKILYVEKEGHWPLLKQARLAERYDMAIITGKGFATEAARKLLERAEQSKDYQIFVLHDADPAGYNIARTLRELDVAVLDTG